MGENNFYSMDKLVEFGMGAAIANQMTIPGAGKSMPINTETVYFCCIGWQAKRSLLINRVLTIDCIRFGA